MNECLQTREYPGGVIAIDSGLIRPQMAACYLVDTGPGLAVVETGTPGSVERILDVITLQGRSPEDISHVIVTHVHLDHAGGAGALMREAPNAELLAHPRAARHLVDPSRLEASARAVYGDQRFDAMYGSLTGVAEERVRIMEDGEELRVGERTFQFLDTPGHARHHFVVWDEDTRGFFSGDTFGISYRDTDSDKGAFIYPTTTPIQFDPPALIHSIDRMMEQSPECMFLTHFGRVTDVERLASDMKEGVRFFDELGERHRDSEGRTALIQRDMMEWLVAAAQDHGVRQDETYLRNLFANDVLLNTQGIEFRLDHG